MEKKEVGGWQFPSIYIKTGDGVRDRSCRLFEHVPIFTSCGSAQLQLSLFDSVSVGEVVR